jgi:type IV pilus assembly protein PilC
MLTYSYTARDKSGQKVSAQIQADSQDAAAKILVDRGLSPLEIEAKQDTSVLGGIKTHIRTKDKIIFSRQLSTLVNAGLPLSQSLRNVRNQTHSKPLKEVIDQVIISVESGSSFADSLAKFPRVFDNVYISLVAAGEASGTLDVSLERLANKQEKDAEILSKIRGAMIYPFLVLLVLFAVIVFMLTTILPQVENFYKTIPGASLPLITTVLLKVSHLIIHFWWLFIILLGITFFSFFKWTRQAAGRAFLDRLKLKMWPFAQLFEKVYMARFARTGSTLVAAGLPIIKMLNTTAEAISNVHVEKDVLKAAEQVKGGKSLSESLRGGQYFLDLVPDMIEIGEQSGTMENMLTKVADYYEKEVDNQIKAISTLIEPLLMVVVGIMALLVVAAVLLPIYSLAGKNLFSAPSSSPSNVQNVQTK